MKNIKVLKTGIDVSKVKEQLDQYPDCLLYTSDAADDA